MADLTYNDVARAVQDGMRSLQNELQRLSSSAAGVEDLRRTLQSIGQKVDRISSDSVDIDRLLNEMSNLQREVQNTSNRLLNIERFCQDISKYLQAFSRTVDDGFRSANVADE